MTFTQIVAKVADRLNLTSAAALTRIGEEVNERYHEVCSSCQLKTSVRTTASAATTIGNRNLIFTCEKIFTIFDNYGRQVTSITRSGSTATVTTTAAHGYATGASVVMAGAVQTEYNGVFTITVTSTTTFTFTVTGTPATPATGTITTELLQTQRILVERSFDELRNLPLQADPPQAYAIQGMGATTVTAMLDCSPSSVYLLNADVEMNLTDLSGSLVPNFALDFHDVLVLGAKADELYKMEKYDLSEKQEEKFEKRLGELRLFIAMSGRKDIYQGKTKPSSTSGNRQVG